MIQLADTASYPETVMVKLANTAIAFPTVTTTVWLYNLASFAETFLGHRYFVNCTKEHDKSENIKEKNARNVFELFFFDKNEKARHQSLFSDVSTSVTLLNLTYCAQYLVLVCLPLCYYRKVEYPLHPPSFLNFHLRQLSPLRNQPLHKMSFCLYQCLYVFKRRFFFR